MFKHFYLGREYAMCLAMKPGLRISHVVFCLGFEQGMALEKGYIVPTYTNFQKECNSILVPPLYKGGLGGVEECCTILEKWYYLLADLFD